MLDSVKRMRSLGFTAAEVSRMGSFNPARLLGIDSTRGSIEVGKRADLIVVDETGGLKMTMIGGQIVFSDL
jgi:N-acetylglucosamine-6-phosphate deacetylase